MLEVRNLKKIYKTKKGAPVHALDGVSLSFPETGMVFLLGKSGSGKSTLLNVCGGLDNPTEGEVIVKGRSSKNFSQSDFDSYRNTFVGFIFQEYNILNEFSVEDNIALALELQGKPKDKQTIAALLEQVDLTGYAKRKPNTLSGGQKQRIAIARALVKKPEIIMADEPTGALDSNTGKQVFDTLKKLSRDKLVIVVSHDREFAEQYGDRIIELKDGKVLSDVSKSHTAAEPVSENMSVLGDVLCIKKGTELTESDFENIKKFLKKSDSDVVIATDEKTVKTFKTAARITDQGVEVFQQTDQEQMPRKAYTKEDSRFIRSKLPIRHAFKIGVSGMKSKPFRLFFTVLLCSVAFVMFGLLSTLNFYNSEATFRQTLLDAESFSVQLRKQYTTTTTWYNYGQVMDSYESYADGKFSDDELAELAASLNHNAFGAAYYNGNFNLQQVTGSYWRTYVSAAAYLPENNSLRQQIQGEYPQELGEMLITSYYADMLIACKTYDSNGSLLEPENYDQLIGKTIVMGGREFKITGILNSGRIPAEYDVLKEAGGQDNYSLMNRFETYLQSSMHMLVFVSQEQVKIFSQESWYYRDNTSNYTRISMGTMQDGEYRLPEGSNFSYSGISSLAQDAKTYMLSGTQLRNGQLLLATDRIGEILGEMFNNYSRAAEEDSNWELANTYGRLANMAWTLHEGEFIFDEDKGEGYYVPVTEAQLEANLAEFIAALKQLDMELTVGIQFFDESNWVRTGELMEYTIAGFYVNTDTTWYYSNCYLTDSDYADWWAQQKSSIADFWQTESEYVMDESHIYYTIHLPGDVTEDRIDAYWQMYSNKDFDENGVRIWMSGGVVDALQNVDYMVESLSQVFLYVGLVLAVFAALLLSNFISVSISNKKREIGILRAVGARSNDVFKIFFSESFVIGCICVAVSSVGSYLLCQVINREFASTLGASVFVFGIASFAVLVGIALVTTLVATFLPVFNAARKKPVDSIRAI